MSPHREGVVGRPRSLRVAVWASRHTPYPWKPWAPSPVSLSSFWRWRSPVR